jgi:hypothetical protein
MSATAVTEQSVIAFVLSSGDMTAAANFTASGIASIVANANIVATLYKFGEEWVVVADDVGTWTAATEQSDTWTVVTASPNTWSDTAIISDTWTTQTSGNNSWQRLG